VDGNYLLSGFIDAHTHIEMSHLSARPFAATALAGGTTGAVLDPQFVQGLTGMNSSL
jgi:adenine deaminase